MVEAERHTAAGLKGTILNVSRSSETAPKAAATFSARFRLRAGAPPYHRKSELGLDDETRTHSRAPQTTRKPSPPSVSSVCRTGRTNRRGRRRRTETAFRSLACFPRPLKYALCSVALVFRLCLQWSRSVRDRKL